MGPGARADISGLVVGDVATSSMTAISAAYALEAVIERAFVGGEVREYDTASPDALGTARCSDVAAARGSRHPPSLLPPRGAVRFSTCGIGTDLRPAIRRH
jgi:hypothetical protein